MYEIRLGSTGDENAEITKGTEPKNNPILLHRASRRREPNWPCYQSTLLENRNCTRDNDLLKKFCEFWPKKCHFVQFSKSHLSLTLKLKKLS